MRVHVILTDLKSFFLFFLIRVEVYLISQEHMYSDVISYNFSKGKEIKGELKEVRRVP